MRFIGIDLETTGLDPKKDFILEIAWVLWDTDYPKFCEKKSYVIKNIEVTEIPQEMIDIHGITLPLIEDRGVSLREALLDLRDTIEKSKKPFDAFIAHNGNQFDRLFLFDKASVYGDLISAFNEVPVWIDSKCDIDYPSTCKDRSLLYLCAFHGFLNPFPHDALSDVLSMLKVCQSYDMREVLQNAKEIKVKVVGEVSYEQRHLAKARGYNWNGEDKKWEKTLRKSQVYQERLEAPFYTYEKKT